LKQSITYFFLFFLAPLNFVFGADASGSSNGVSPYAYEIGKIFNLPITNSILTTWVISLGFIIAIRLMVGKPSLVPNKAQSVFETLIEGLKGIIEPIMGKQAFSQAFPLLLAFFVFILIHNWSGLLPGVGVFGFEDASGNFNYWFRPATSDLNTAIGLSIIGMIFWAYLVLKVSGMKFFLWELFGNKADKSETPAPIYLLLTPIFICVGFIEIISIAIRPVSLSFRLYGNIFGGENLLSSMTALAPLAPVPFYFLEALVGVVQAFIFTLLIAIYIGLVTNHGEEH